MAVLEGVELDVAAAVAPELPVVPVTATGLPVPTDVAAPVAPVLVALDWEVASPVSPEVARGVAVRLAVPPPAPLASPVTTAEPPAAVMAPVEAAVMLMFRAAPPAPAMPATAPPSPPSPGRLRAAVALAASPVVPEKAS